jgi:DNA-binding FadR family transcriptional regulator
MNATSLVRKTLDALMEVVLDSTPGSFFPPQDELSRQLEVSRTVLREALSRLEHMNVITIRPKIGTKINAASEWRVVNTEVLIWRKKLAECRIGKEV